MSCFLSKWIVKIPCPQALAICLFLSLLQPHISYCQYNNFTYFSINEGLPQSNVFCLMQDRRGYIWLGTDGGGACRFDGRKFEIFNKSNGLSGNVVRCLFEDSKGRIWFGTDEGITVYDGLSFRTIDKKDSLKGSTVLSVIEDNSHHFWACTDDHGINKIIMHDSAVAISNISVDNGLSSPSVFDALMDEKGRIWLATLYGGINILTLADDTFHTEHLSGGIDIPSDLILSLEKDMQGNIWCGTYDAGVFKIESNDANGEYSVFTYHDLSKGSVWDILVRKNGRVWIGTGEDGVFRLIQDHAASGKFTVEHYTTEEGLPINQILSLLEDDEGNIWLGTNGSGLCKFGGDLFNHYGIKEGFGNNNIMGMDMDRDGSLWLATDGGGLIKLDFIDSKPLITAFSGEQGLPSDFISVVKTGHATNTNLWLGTLKNGVVKYNGKTFVNFTESDGMKDNRIYSLHIDRHGIVWVGTAGGISLYDGLKFLNISMEELKVSDDGIKAILEDQQGNIWFGTAGALARYGGDSTITTFDQEEGLNSTDVNCLAEDAQGNIWIGTNGGGLYFFDTHTSSDKPIAYVKGNGKINTNTFYSLVMLNDSTLIAGSIKGFYKLLLNADHEIISARNYDKTDGFIGVECNENAILKDPVGRIWFGTTNGLTCYDPSKELNANNPPVIHITGLNLFFKQVDWSVSEDSISPWNNLPVNLELPFSKNHLTFYFSALSFRNPQKITYSYLLDGLDEEWSPASPDNKVTFSGLPFGEYTFKVIASNADGQWTEEPATYHFVILPPWYRTIWFYVLCIVSVIVIFYVYIKIRERKLKKEKAILEMKVKERTAEVVKQKEEIEEKNKEITDSINYASRIQNAILPLDDVRKKLLPDSFILFKPKDIVSGDFYWFTEQHGVVIFTAADCTGHGVPGAFMSMIGSALLNEVVNKNGITKPGSILDEVRNGIIFSLKQTGEEGKQKDGMDMSLCAWHPKDRLIEFAGANNSLFVIRKCGSNLRTTNDEAMEPNISDGKYNLFEIKASKQPVGYYTGNHLPFENRAFHIEKGDTIYSFSDGYPDQFGGPNGKKFKYKSFKKLLISIQQNSMDVQKTILDQTIEEWRGAEEQVDDICVIGVRI